MDEVKNIVAMWQQAHRVAGENPSLLLKDESEATIAECVRRMRRLQQAEDGMLALEGRDDLPGALQRYFAAKNDSGCPTCWLGARGPVHHECDLKIKRFFQAETDLAYAVFE